MTSTTFRTGLLFLALIFTPAYALAQHPELKRVRALLVIDSNSNLKKSVLIDKGTMTMVLRSGIPRERCDLTVLEGDAATPAKVFDHYKDLETNEAESLVFYFAGHGGADPEKGHFLAMSAGRLYRSDLRDAMKKKQPGLIVMMTDCCSNLIQTDKKPQYPTWYDAKSLTPAHRYLFFQHRGVVEMTAATKNFSFGDDVNGGFFTHTLGQWIFKSQEKLDTNGDGFLSWPEFGKILQRETQLNYLAKQRAGRVSEDLIREQMQIPEVFATGETGDLASLSRATWTGDAAKSASKIMNTNGGFAPWRVYPEGNENLVLYRKAKTRSSSVDARGETSLNVTVGDEHYWTRVKR